MRLTKSEKKEIKRLLRELVVARDGEKCLRCGRTDTLQMSHIYSVGQEKKLEYDEDNLKLLCLRCHLYWWHKEPLEASEWIKKVIPKERLQRLHLRKISNAKNPMDYKLLKLYLENKIKEYTK